MRFFLHFAFKNLSRYTKRTLITASAIAFGILMFLFTDSILRGGEKDSERNLIWYETASLRIYNINNEKEWEKASLKHLIENPDPIVDTLRSAGISATTRTAFNGELVVYRDPFPEDGSIQVRVHALNPESDGTVYRIRQDLTEGSSWIEEGSNQVILGSWLAEDIGAEIGYPITLVTRTRDGAYQTIDLEIVGLTFTGNPLVNRTAVLIDQDFADKSLVLAGAVSQIDMAFPVTETVAKSIESASTAIFNSTDDSLPFPTRGNGLSMLSWRDLAADYLSLAVTKQSGSFVILGLIFIIALVGISNTMLLAMFERRKELGMMRALGMRDGEIRLCFLLEAGGIGIVGGIIGLGLAVMGVGFLVTVGIDYSFILRDFDAGYRVASVFRGVWRLDIFLLAFVFAVLMSMVSALIPTHQALKMPITECLHSET